jgi:nicotinamide riboside kinase
MSALSKPYIITIVGPESSGKTTLARQLSQILKVPWVPEYAREYLSGLGRPYEEQDLSVIAEGQLKAISSVGDELLPAAKSENLRLALSQLQVDLLETGQGRSFISFTNKDFGDLHRPIIIVDSGMLSIKMWAEIKYGTVVPVVEKGLENDMTDLYVLCRPVFTWANDPLRESPLLLDRVWIYNQFLKNLFIMQKRSISG